MPKHTPDLIGSAEVCRLIQINPATVSRWVASGKLTPVHKMPGDNGAYLFDRAHVEQVKEAEEAKRAERAAKRAAKAAS